MLKIVDRHPNFTAEGSIVTGNINLTLALATVMSWKAAYNKRRTNTGLTEKEWAMLDAPQSRSAYLHIASAIGVPLDKEKNQHGLKVPDDIRSIIDLAYKLRNNINHLAEMIQLRDDGPGLDDAGHTIRKPDSANPEGGFTWLDQGKVFSKQLMDVVEPGYYTEPSAVIPKTLFEDKPLDLLASRYARLEIALRTDALTNAPQFWDLVWGKDDPRNRNSDMVDGKRALNVVSLFLTAQLQPYLLIFRNIVRFFNVPAIKDYITKYLDSALLPVVFSNIEQLMNVPLTPTAAYVDRLSQWTTVATRWGELPCYLLCRQANGIKNPLEWFHRDNPFMKLTQELALLFASNNFFDNYKAALAHLDQGGTGAPIPPTSALMPAAGHTDGLFTNMGASDALEACMKLWVRGDDYISSPNKIDPLVPSYPAYAVEDRGTKMAPPPIITTIQPDDTDLIGDLVEYNTPLRWMPTETIKKVGEIEKVTHHYQGDAHATIIVSRASTVAAAFALSESELEKVLRDKPDDWRHLYPTLKLSEPAAPYFFRSPRTDKWWSKKIPLPYLGPSRFHRWANGKRLDIQTNLDRESWQHGLEWFGYANAEVPEMTVTMEGMWDSTLTSIKAKG